MAGPVWYPAPMDKFILALILVGTVASTALADDIRYYDASGRYQGRASTSTSDPRQQRLYDPQGRYQGRVMTDQDGNARMYDAQGKYMGRAMRNEKFSETDNK